MKEFCAASSWKDCPFPTLAAVFIPPKAREDIYTPEVALIRGTLFPQLDKPLQGLWVKSLEEFKACLNAVRDAGYDFCRERKKRGQSCKDCLFYSTIGLCGISQKIS